MPDRLRFSFLNVKAEAEGPRAIKVAALLALVGMLSATLIVAILRFS